MTVIIISMHFHLFYQATQAERKKERSALEVHLKSQQYFMYQHTQTQRERGSLVIPTSASKVV